MTDAIEDAVVELAWADNAPFEAIELAFGLKEAEVIALMRRRLKPSSFRLWRQRVSGRRSKHRRRQVLDDRQHHAESRALTPKN
ncbi:MAG: TIGR03643 family protein [Myxococcota bacterium]